MSNYSAAQHAYETREDPNLAEVAIEPSEDQIARAVKNIRSDRNAVTELLTESPWIAEWADWMIDNNPAFRAEVELSKAVTDEAMRIAKADRESAALEAAIDGSECND